MKNKILLVSDFHANVYGWRKELIEAFIREGADFALAVPYGEQLDYFGNIGCKLYDVIMDRKSTGVLSNYALLLQYKKILLEYKPDLVLLYGSKGMLYTGYLCKKMNIPYFSNINGLGTVESTNLLTKKIILTLYKMVIPGATCVFFQNEYNMNKLIGMNIVNKNYRLIPGSGVNIDKYCFLEYPNSDRINFLFCARVMKEKGIIEFLEAAKILKMNGYNVEFDVVGMYDDEFSVKLINENKNIINYYGFQKDVTPFIKKTNCVVLPSFYGEGISNSLLESASSGRPIITTNMPGCRETVIDGETGFLVEPKNYISLYHAMKTFCEMSNDKRKKMGSKAREYITKNFRREIVVDAYIDEYIKVFKRGV